MNNLFENLKKYKLFRILPLLYTFFIFFLSIVPGKYDPAQKLWDKFKHTLAFFIFFVLYNTFLNLDKRKIFILGLLFGIFIEFVQYFIPYRSCDIKDILADLIGLLLGYFIFDKILDKSII